MLRLEQIANGAKEMLSIKHVICAIMSVGVKVGLFCLDGKEGEGVKVGEEFQQEIKKPFQ